ncbi:MAG: YggS family pyridoxal phosphate-dependent enzyme [Balneolales bacterium]|nr:YggS family pyridoxal phosphate-dependent enzyme [Balneolales bacterium]
MSTNHYKDNLQDVYELIQKACDEAGRDPSEITLIAVSKTNPAEAVEAFRELGQLHFGENKVQELVPKMEHFSEDSQIQWHMIGTLQTNKIKYLTPAVHWIDSVPKLKALKEIQKRAASDNRIINVMIQVNISDEDQKSGCEPDKLPGLLEAAEKMENLTVRGLMGMASFTASSDEIRRQFALLKTLLEKEKQRGYDRANLDHLSMGMTNDLREAILEGSTMLRIGTALFGKRDY